MSFFVYFIREICLWKNIWKYIKELNQKGVTVCLTTHYLEEAEKLCDYITIIDNGIKLMSDTKKNILNLIDTKTANFVLEKKIENIPNNLKKYNPSLYDDILSIQYEKSKVNIQKIINDLKDNGILFKEINTSESDLEDVFIQLTKKYER